MLLLPLLTAAHAATLSEAWAAAEKDGTELPLLHEQTVQAESLKTQAWALVSPKLVAGATYTINEYETTLDFSSMIPEEFQSFFDGSEPIVLNKKQYFAWNASVVQPLFSGSALPAMRAVNQSVLAARAAEDASRAQVRSGIAQAYYGVVVAREAVALADKALESAQKHAKLATQQVDVGLAPPTAKLQADIGVARAERQLASAKEGKVQAEAALAQLTGWPTDTPVTLPEPPTLPYADADAAERRAQEHRPSIVQAEHQLLAARAAQTASDLAWLPSVDGRFTWSYNENSGFSDDKDMWLVVFSANWTLWDGGARIAQEAKSASEKRSALLASERAQDTTTADIHGLWEAYATAEVSLGTVDREVALSTENLRLAEAAFTAGTVSFIEVEDARVGLLAAQLGALQERMKHDLAAMALLAATGDL